MTARAEILAAMGELEVKAIREIEAAFNRGDIGAMVACLASDAEWEIAEANPSARTLHGQAEIRAYLEDWRDTVQGLHYEGERYIDAGDVVVQVGTMTARPSAGAELTVPLAFVSRFRDGVPVRTEEYLDVDAALEAAGLPD